MLTDGVEKDTSDLWGIQQRWSASQYLKTFGNRLRSSIEFVRSCQTIEMIPRPHYASILTLLENSWSMPEYWNDAIELTLLLKGHPFRLGYWIEWERTLRRAIEICRRIDQTSHRLRLQIDLSGVLFQCGQMDEALENLQDVRHSAQCPGYYFEFALSSVAVSNILLYKTKDIEAEVVLKEAETWPFAEVSATSSDWGGRSRILLQRGMMLRRQADFELAKQYATQAIEAFERVSQPDWEAIGHAYRMLGLIQRDQQNFPDAIISFRRAIKTLRSTGDRFAVSWAMGNLGLVYWNCGRLNQADRMISRSVKTAKRLNAQWQLTCEVGNLGLVALSQGRLVRACYLLEQQLDLANQIGNAHEIARAYGNRGVARFHLGDYTGSMRDLEWDLKNTPYTIAPISAGCASINLGRCYLALGDSRRAFQLTRKAYMVACAHNHPGLKVIALRCLAECVSPKLHTIKWNLLYTAYYLADQRWLDRAGCLLSMAPVAPSRIQERLWNKGSALLDKIGANAWLRGHSIENPPKLLALT